MPDAEVETALDCRYVGQSHELVLKVPEWPVTATTLQRLASDFHDEHARAYGFNAPDERVEIVTLRLIAAGRIPKPALKTIETGTGDPSAAVKAMRPVYFAEEDGYAETTVFDRYRLRAGNVVTGPAIIEELDSATVVHPGHRAEVDRHGNLSITAEGVHADD
jgi:N-methylhydantoinase A/oxoprolinase/acetone carboxylase beta subunit